MSTGGYSNKVLSFVKRFPQATAMALITLVAGSAFVVRNESTGEDILFCSATGCTIGVPIIFPAGGTTEFPGTLSGASIHAQDNLTSSGTFALESTSTRAELIVDNVAAGDGDSIINLRLPGTAQWILGLDDSDSDKFKIDNGSSLDLTSRFVIDSTGQVGIGKDTPVAKLEVVGSISGATLHTETNVTSSGTLTVDGLTHILRYVTVPLCNDGTACAVGSGSTFFIGSEFNNYKITEISLCASDTGTTGSMTIQLKNVVDNVLVLSTALTLDSGERCTATADVPAVINTSNQTVTTNDILVPYITGVHTTPAQGASVKFTLSPP